MIVSLENISVGHDGIHNRCLKIGTKLLFQLVLKLFNSSLSIGFIPEAWKLGHVILVSKPGKHPHAVQSYRPITLFVETHHLLPKNQAGFRKNRCTADNLLHLTHDICFNLHQSRKIALVVFDIKQAFDSVWNSSLV